MVFNSIEFFLFFTVFFLFYWFVFKELWIQNLFILLASCVFYAWWDWRFLSLILGTSFINFILGKAIDKTNDEKKKGLLVTFGILVCLGSLLFFKYYNFFVISFTQAFSLLNIRLNPHTLNLILPLGISFYTFRSISYLLDIYNEKIKPANNLIIFSNYISFFPTLLAGPIDRAKSFIPQLEKARVFKYAEASEGLRQILWGLFKKVVIADSCAVTTDIIFGQYQMNPGSTLVLGSFMYIIQVYADFSGYSDMAIGFSRLLGFKITRNFNFPFFAQNIAEFWQRWHISLTTWMTDYVYTPLSFAFRNLKKAGTILAILVNFILVGFWHGANWTFIAFGFLQGCYFIPLVITGGLSKKRNTGTSKLLPSVRESINMICTFALVMFTSVLFRANDLSQAKLYYSKMFSSSLFRLPHFTGMVNAGIVLILIVFFMCIEWLGKTGDFALSQVDKKFGRPQRWIFYFLIILTIVFYSETNEMPFIYSKF
jgi:alginate O-acetyltransferase complex protein AlgI